MIGCKGPNDRPIDGGGSQSTTDLSTDNGQNTVDPSTGDNPAQNAEQGHKHTLVAIADEVYLATPESRDDLVSVVRFYRMQNMLLLNDQIIELDYDEEKKIKDARLFRMNEGEKCLISDGFDVTYQESGELAHLSFTAEGEPCLSFTAITKEDGKSGYEIRTDSEDKSTVLLGENGLTAVITSEECNMTITYDEKGRISECKEKSEESTMPGHIIFHYEDSSCCFSEIILKAEESEEMEITAPVERNEKHQITRVGWKHDALGFLMECTYKYTSDDTQLVLSSKQNMEGRNQSFTYAYDDNDRLTESVETREGELRGGLAFKYVDTKKYNAEGIVIYHSSVEETMKDGMPERWDKSETVFDENGIRSSGTDESKSFDSEGNPEYHSKTVYTFDKDGNLLEEVETHYDKDGNVIE